ncbi:MAG: hypothetical protein ACYDBJ_23925 [Aggregatilineales bacterium]
MKRLCSAALALTALFTLVIGVVVWTKHGAPPDWTYVQQVPEPIPPGKARIWPMTVSLPQPPFTLEATGRFSAISPPSAKWGVTLDVASLQVSNDGQFFAPDMPNPIWFYGLYGPGVFNQISLAVGQNWQAQMRINGQLAWEGTLPASLNANPVWTLFAEGGTQYSGAFTWQRVAIYIPDAAG